MKAHSQSKTPPGERDLWETPVAVFERICQVTRLNPLMDVCATASNRKCKFWYGLDQGRDSLTMDWEPPLVWMNPPYSDLAAWTAKAAAEARKGVIVLGLVPHSPDTRWFQANIEARCPTVFIPDGRIHFQRPDGTIDRSNPKPSCFPIWAPWGNNGQPNYVRFVR